MVICLYDHTMHKTTFFIIILIKFTKLLSHKVINCKNRDVTSRTGSRFILRATMAESDSTSDSSVIHDESDASSSTSFSSEWSDGECVSGPSFGMKVTPYWFEPEPSTDHDLP